MAPVQEKISSASGDIYGEYRGLCILPATRRLQITTLLILLAAIISFVGCNKAAKPSLTTFTSPDEAGKGLLDAAKTGDQNALLGSFWHGFERHNLLWRCGARQGHGWHICDRL